MDFKLISRQQIETIRPSIIRFMKVSGAQRRLELSDPEMCSHVFKSKMFDRCSFGLIIG